MENYSKTLVWDPVIIIIAFEHVVLLMFLIMFVYVYDFKICWRNLTLASPK